MIASLKGRGGVWPLALVLLAALGVALALGVQEAAADESSALVARYPFNGDASDASGNGHDGTLVDGASFSGAGKFEGALLLDGSGDAVSVADADDLDFGSSDPMTITAWFKLSESRAVYHIVGKRVGCGAGLPGMNYQLAHDASGALQFNSSGVGGGGVDTGLSAAVGTFTHIAATYDGVDTLKVYVDGVLATTDSSYALGPVNGADLLIGTSGTCPAAQDFPGRIDEVQLYSCTLSAEDIAELVEEAFESPESASCEDGDDDDGDEDDDDDDEDD